MHKRRWIALIIFGLLLIYLITEPTFWSDFWGDNIGWEEKEYRDGKGDELVIIDIEGPIFNTDTYGFSSYDYNHEITLNQLEHAFTDEQIKGILLRVNSPGGGVSECDEIYNSILSLQEQYEKPLVAYLDNVAASGGYYIVANADKIYSSRNTLTGSIGVIISGYNYYRLADEYGVEDQTFKSGPYKDIMNPLREMSTEEKDIMQSLVDDSYSYFLEAIMDGRNISRAMVSEVADGRLLTAKQAMAGNLIDEIGFLDDAIEGISALTEIEDPRVIRYIKRRTLSLDYLLSSLWPSLLRVNGINLTGFPPDTETPRLMYIYN